GRLAAAAPAVAPAGVADALQHPAADLLGPALADGVPQGAGEQVQGELGPVAQHGVSFDDNPDSARTSQTGGLGASGIRPGRCENVAKKELAACALAEGCLMRKMREQALLGTA